jgi:hypothetical protein
MKIKIKNSKRHSRFMIAGIIFTITAGIIYCSITYGKATSTTSNTQKNNFTTPARVNNQYRILAWNNLGMHCYNRDFSDIAILPPYNTLWAQVIKVSDPPVIVTSGIKVEYSFPLNTYSAGKKGFPDKTNFWQYVQPLFGSRPQVNIGLAGKGLQGQMDLSGDHYVAEGIPLTEFTDTTVSKKDLSRWVPSPYQLAQIVVKDSVTGEKLATNIVVAPVSSELNCINCHADNGDATTRYPVTPTGKVTTNILAIHDYLNPGKYSPALMDSRPVLCANCHASAALGAAGQPGVSILSNAMHNHHKDLMDITPDTDGCYNCHPGPNTQCLRCTMSQNYALNCTTCHGTMEQVSKNTSPWLNEPKCDNPSCHGNGYTLNKALYRESMGHGNVYCAGCHDSPHAIAKSRESNDAIKFTMLQGYAGTLKECTTCHATMPDQAFIHGML